MRRKTDKGSRNLILLGTGAIVFAGLMTGIELMIYRYSGDIYLDRSRPGYLPEEDEVEEEAETSSTYVYGENGEIDKEGLEEYLEELNKINAGLKKLDKPYDADPLSDETLGI